MNSTTTEILKRFREKFSYTGELMQDDAVHPMRLMETFWLAEIEAARRQAISEEREKIIIDALNSLKPTEEECKCLCHTGIPKETMQSMNVECQHCRK